MIYNQYYIMIFKESIMSTIVRIIIKAILIIVAFYISGVILLFMKASGYDGALPLFILVAAMIAIIKTIWSYKPSISNDISLKKDD